MVQIINTTTDAHHSMSYFIATTMLLLPVIEVLLNVLGTEILVTGESMPCARDIQVGYYLYLSVIVSYIYNYLLFLYIAIDKFCKSSAQVGVH